MTGNKLCNYTFRVHSDEDTEDAVQSQTVSCEFCSTTFDILRKNDMYVVSDRKIHFGQLCDVSGFIQITFDDSVDTGLCPSCVTSELNKYLQFSPTYKYEPNKFTAFIMFDQDSETKIESLSIIGDCLKLNFKLYFVTGEEDYLALPANNEEKITNLFESSVKLETNLIPDYATITKVVVSSNCLHSNYFETEFTYSLLAARL